jgi:hypothetical protein
MFFLFKLNIDFTINILNYEITEYNKDRFEYVKNYDCFLNSIIYIFLLYFSYYFYVLYKDSKEYFDIVEVIRLLRKKIFYVILMTLQIMYTVVYLKMLIVSILILFKDLEAFFSMGMLILMIWWTVIYYVSILLTIKFHKLIIKKENKNFKRKKTLIYFIIFYNLFVYFGSQLIIYICFSASIHESTPNRFVEVFVPHGMSTVMNDNILFGNQELFFEE